jgi:S-methylmethionine-dependent homocysteine/selenocysteine methylase
LGKLTDLLAKDRLIILDGAMGTELHARGCDISLPLWSSRALFEKPDVVRHIHIDYIDCGADIITTNTFRTQRRTFEKADYTHEGLDYKSTARALTADAVDLAREAVMIAAEDDEDVLVAGSVAPLEDCYRPELVPDPDTLRNEHSEHVQNLIEAGSDIIIAETMTSLNEIKAVLDVVSRFDTEYIISLTPRNSQELLSGEKLEDAVSLISQYSPSVISVNCIHPSLGEEIISRLKSLTDKPLGIYCNIGDPDYKEGDELKPTVSEDEYLNFAKKWKSLGVKIIGGCCGTTPLYIMKLNSLKS